ncbi:MAG: hypothetical protein CXZ00_02050 [Acidobacteria bacterium]|nr:MAG: hypothetical protein CXZ00_02050 [Acidobacteriota bacterium]
MERQDADELREELKIIKTALGQMKEDLASIKKEVHVVHSVVTDLPSGKQWVESEGPPTRKAG